MFKFYIGLLFAFPLMVNAQPAVQYGSMSIICSDTKTVIDEILKYKEILLWSGIEGNSTKVALWQNLETKTFTITKTDVIKDITCIISLGDIPKES